MKKKLIQHSWNVRALDDEKFCRSLLQYCNAPSLRDGLSPPQKLFWPRYPASSQVLLPSIVVTTSSRCCTASWRHFQIIYSPLQHPHSRPARNSCCATYYSTKSSVLTLGCRRVPTSIFRGAEPTPMDPTTSGVHTQRRSTRYKRPPKH